MVCRGWVGGTGALQHLQAHKHTHSTTTTTNIIITTIFIITILMHVDLIPHQPPTQPPTCDNPPGCVTIISNTSPGTDAASPDLLHASKNNKQCHTVLGAISSHRNNSRPRIAASK